MATLEELKKELKPYKNTLVIADFFDLAVLVDVIDGDDEDNMICDFYWVFEKWRGREFASCCGGWIPLKGFIPDRDYADLVKSWNMNRKIKAE